MRCKLLLKSYFACTLWGLLLFPLKGGHEYVYCVMIRFVCMMQTLNGGGVFWPYCYGLITIVNYYLDLICIVY